MALLVSGGQTWFRKGGVTMADLKLSPELLGDVDQYIMFQDLPSPLGMSLTPSNRQDARDYGYLQEGARGMKKELSVFSFSNEDIEKHVDEEERQQQQQQQAARASKNTTQKKCRIPQQGPAKVKAQVKSRKRAASGTKKPKCAAKKRKKTTRKKATVGVDARTTRLARNVYEKQRVHKLNEELAKLRQNLIAHGVIQGKVDKKSVIAGAVSELRRLQSENASLRSKIEDGAGAL
jgi:hypothetical protein